METHIIPISDNKNIIFVPVSINYFIADNKTVELVKRIDDGYENIRDLFPGLTIGAYDKVKNILYEKNTKRKVSISEQQLDRLIINVSNDCNMSCKYCYANQGTYGESKNFISLECLEKTLDVFYCIFKKIGLIQLFGGEPTMNMKAIEFSGEYLKKNKYKTRLGLVTNATIVNDTFIEMINEYDIYVTVSVDVEKTHDSLRPFPNNSKSWNLVKSNIHKLQKETSQPSQIEFTYTKMHEDKNLRICDVLAELKEEYGNIPVHIAPVCSTNSAYHLSNRNSFVQSVDDIYRLKEKGCELTYSTLKAFELSLKHKIPFDYFCGAGISTLAVSTHGDIYPCFYFIDNQNFKAGNVYDIVSDIKRGILEKRNAIYDKPKEKTQKCKNCFAKSVCTGCLGANYTETGDPFMPDNSHCTMTKNMIESILRKAV